MRRAVVALVVLLAAAGCASDPTVGYAALSTYRTDIRTIAVPIVENDTFARGIEFDLTDALIKTIEARTPYKVAPAARADTILQARIQRVDLDQLSKSPLTGLGEEVIISVSIDFEWRDLRTESALVTRTNFTGQRVFVPSAPSRERVELGRFAVVQSLASDVVDEMRAIW